jgi:hypothetical protein
VATAVGVGTAEIRARAVSDTTRQTVAQLVVTARPLAIVFSTRTLGLNTGRTGVVTAALSADPGVPTGIRWITRNASIATVNDEGVVQAVGNGSTYLVAIPDADPTRLDSVRVRVAPQLATSWNAARLGGPLIEDILSLWAPTSALAYAVNSNGDVFRWNGSQWTSVARGADFSTAFTAVHGTAANAVTAVGSNGTIVRFNGTTWTKQPSGVSVRLDDVWMHSETEGWAVGDGGTVLRYANGAWSAGASGTTLRLRAVWGTATFAFAVGDGGVIVRHEAGTWQPVESGTFDVLHDVLGVANGSVTAYAVGEFGTVVRWTGLRFEPEATSSNTTLRSLAGDPTGVLVAGGDGIALQRLAGVWSDQSPPYRTRFTSVAVDATGGLWLGGQRGLVMRRQSGAWSTLSLTPDLLDAWSTGPQHAIAVGELGFVFRFDGVEWVRQTTPTLERLNTVWASSPNVAFAGGDNGLMLRWNGSTWSEVSSPTLDHIYAMWGASDTAVWAVSDGGEVLFWDGAAWSLVHAQSEPLYGVYGTSASDVHVVGLAGAALHWNGSTWRSRAAASNNVLVGLWAADSVQSVSVGVRDFSSGVALRYTGVWSELPSGTSRILSAVWGVVGSDLYAVGDAGVIVRYDGQGWQTMASGTTEFLWAITGAPTATGSSFAVGLNGAVVQGQAGGSASAAIRSGRSGGARTSLAPAAGATRRSRLPLPDGAARFKRGARRR